MDLIIGKKIRNLRKAYHLTQQELADNLGIARATLSGYENKISQPDLETLKRISIYFSVSTDYLLGLDDNQNASMDQDFFNRLIYYTTRLNATNRDILLGTMASMIKEQQLENAQEKNVG